MEFFFRKYFWVVHLTFLALAAYFGAKTVNALLASKLESVPTATDAPGASPALAAGGSKIPLSMEALSKVTGIPMPEKPAEASDDQATEQAKLAPLDDQVAVKSGLRVRLVGTMVANRPEWCFANVEDPQAKEIKVYMVGDSLQDATVLEIQRKRMIINNKGRKEYIDSETGDGQTAQAAPAPAGEAVASNIRPSGENTYTIPRAELDAATQNLNNLAMQARIVPAFKDGVSQGFKLFSIKPDSLYSKIGIQNGDIVKKINGMEINSPDKALEVYSKLKDATKIDVELDRGGSSQRMTYNVR